MSRFSLLSASFLLCAFIACNKDETIIGNIPEDNPQKPTPGKPMPDYPSTGLDYQVVEYLPAPGQYINASETGLNEVFTMKEACEYAQQRFEKGLFVSLGAWGGSVTVKFKESIPNIGGYNFSILSNFFTDSNEPGIVWVMQDTNKNGIPDEEWYELRGSFFGEPGYERNYWVTYSRPDPETATPWIDSNGETGFVNYMGTFHKQEFYYPNWVEEDSYTLYGSRLPSRAYQDPDTGLWKNGNFEWGYADNFGSDVDETKNMNYFRISDAVDKDAQSVVLASIDFIKVQTAINGSAGWLGENSTEVCGFFTLPFE